MRSLDALLGCLVVAALTTACDASAQSTFRISQLWSSLDGSLQVIALTESAGQNGQNHFKGLTLTVTHGALSKRFTFYDDLAFEDTANRTVFVAATPSGTIVDVTNHVAVLAFPDFIVPARFLATDGGTVDFAGIDQVSYPPLPNDGTTAWYRDGTLAPARVAGGYGCHLSPSSGCPGTITPTPTRVQAVEYYNVALDHYFMTASAAEIDALDSGRIPGWQRTGESLAIGEAVRTAQDLEYVYYGGPVCRFYLPPGQGDSHFFSAFPAECAAVRARFPGLVEESSAAFYAAAPDPATGECGVIPGIVDGDLEMAPIYRLWNHRADTNHRYTANPATRDAMIARGWVPEGYGPDGVVMCE